MKTQKNYINRGDLLESWEGETADHFNLRKLHALRAIYDCREFLRLKNGEKLDPVYKVEELEDRLQVVYTDTSAHAGLWLPNVEVMALYGERLTLHGVAMSKKRESVLLFTNARGEDLYFYNWEFYQYQKAEQKKARARGFAEFIKNSNKALQTIAEVLKVYEGKPYGEKTRQKLSKEINEAIKCYGVRAWYDNYYNFFTLEANKPKTNGERKIYTVIADDKNKITARGILQITPRQECNAITEWNKTRKLAEKIKTKSAELCELMKTYRESADMINITPKDFYELGFKIDSELVRGEL